MAPSNSSNLKGQSASLIGNINYRALKKRGMLLRNEIIIIIITCNLKMPQGIHTVFIGYILWEVRNSKGAQLLRNNAIA